MYKLLLCVLLTLIAVSAFAQSAHDGNCFWLPIGDLKIGDAASEKDFNYSATANSMTFTITPMQFRMHMPIGQFVIIDSAAPAGAAADMVVDGKPAGAFGRVTFLTSALPKWGEKITVEVKGAPAAKGRLYRVYYTDDCMKLGGPVSGSLAASNLPKNYTQGMTAFWSGDYKKAKSEFLSGAKAAQTPEASRLFRRLARWADAQTKFAKLKTGEGFYNLGLYSMHNGFWYLAADCFTKATELMPKNPDAWYMLGDAKSYATSDLDMKLEKIMPYYQKAADLYPKENSNTWRNHVGLFKKLRVSKDVVSPMTDEQIAYVKQVWGWCATIMTAASRGSLRMVNDFVVYDKEFDNSAPGEMDPRPFEGLFARGSTETFQKFNGWGASMCFGHDCGPDRSAHCNIGLRGWEVMFHEWNHSLDWAMITSELGIGVPATHSSDSCGFQPVSSMGMGHHSCNRYYMTPGMYRYVRGSDPPTTPFITEWLTWEPMAVGPEVAAEKFTDKDQTFITEWAKNTHAAVTAAEPPKGTPSVTPKVEDGYINLKTTFAGAPKNASAFSRSFVYSPKKQKVRMWVGADDDLRVWLNGRLIHKGNYWAVCEFQDAREKDQTAKGVMLEQGWNELIVQTTNMQHADVWYYSDPRPDQWGFSIRICDIYNKEVPGIKYQAAQPAGFTMPAPPFVVDPKAPKTYKWEQVADDWTTLIPELTLNDLRAITGYKTMKATDDFFFDLTGENLDPAIKRYVIDKPDQNNLVLNNELHWFIHPREMIGFVRYKRGNQTRDLVFMRPEAYEAYFNMVPVSKEAKKLGIKRHGDQVIGYFGIVRPEEFPDGRVVLVVDTYLGDKLPVDEEDLLNIASLN